MITDKIKLILEDTLSTAFDMYHIYGIDTCTDEIFKLFTPKLQWKQEAERIWRGQSPFYYSWTIYLHSDGYWEVVKADKPKFQGTLEECKKECERIFMELYLTACV